MRTASFIISVLAYKVRRPILHALHLNRRENGASGALVTELDIGIATPQADRRRAVVVAAATATLMYQSALAVAIDGSTTLLLHSSPACDSVRMIQYCEVVLWYPWSGLQFLMTFCSQVVLW